MQVETVRFPGASGAELTALVDNPKGTPVATALLAHCFACAEHGQAAARIAQGLADVGIATLRFDVAGGEPPTRIDDLVAAADWLRSRGQAPSLLLGHSLGGTAMLGAAGRVPEAVAVAVINAPADPHHAVEHLHGSDGGSRRVVRSRLLAELDEEELLRRVRALGKALLLFHAPLDPVVGVDNARRIFQAARHPKSFVALDGADHLVSDRADAAYLAHVLAAWASRYLRAHVQLPAVEGEQEAPDVVVVRESGPGRLAQRIEVGRHLLRADEPERLGGTDTGPSPYDLLLAGLGACTSMTLRLYADRKGWPLERVDVRLAHAKVHATDCADCETQVGMLDRIEREVTLRGPLDDAQRARLLEIAERCPVHRTLESEVWVETKAGGD